jgi:hypothetical protein
MSVQDIINRVTDANYKYYNDRDFFKKEIIDCMIIHICRKHAVGLSSDPEYYWNDYPGLLVTDISDLDTEEILDGTYSFNEIKNLVSICTKCLNKTKITEVEQKMEVALIERYKWLNEIKHSSKCNSQQRDELIGDIKDLILDDDSDYYSNLCLSSEQLFSFEDLFEDKNFKKKLVKILFKYEKSFEK